MEMPEGTAPENSSAFSAESADTSLHPEEIAILAYEKWLRKGKPANTALRDWVEAEAELKQLKIWAQWLAGSKNGAIQQLLQAMLNSTHAVIFIKDSLGRYLLTNCGFEALWTAGRAALGKTDYDLFPAETAAQLRIDDLKVLAETATLIFEETIPQADGLHTYLAIKFPLTGPSGLPHAVCTIATDITERKRLQLHWEVGIAATQVLAEARDLPEAGGKLLQTLCERFGWQVGRLWVVDPPAGQLRCEVLWQQASGPNPECLRWNSRLARGQGLPGQVWVQGIPLWDSNITEDPLLRQLPDYQQNELRATLAFPIKNGQEVVGVLEFFSRQLQEPDLDLLVLMNNLSSQINQFIQRRQAEKIVYQRDREFQLARDIQRELLPRATPQVPGFVIAGISHPAQETGGDYFDFFPMPEGNLGIVIGDASGHGVAAALVIAETRAYLRALATTDCRVDRILAGINRYLAEDIGEGYFVTLLLACLNPTKRTLVYSSAGHPPGYLLDAQGNVKAVLASTGMPLGLEAQATFPVGGELSLDPQDLLFLYTDGITEACSPEESLFGIRCTLTAVRDRLHLPPGELLKQLLATVQAFVQGNPPDDLTAVLIKADAPAQEGS